MPKATVRAFIHHYDDHGRRTKPAERSFALLCTKMKPQVLEISLRDERSTRFRSIRISRAELERVLKDNPR
jgi:hypothetical protein